jgi:hypothetical protein
MPLPAVRAVAPDVQRRAFDGAGLETGHAPAPSGTSGGGGRGGVNIDLTITADDVGKVSGEGATTLARRNAEMRESRARDKSRVDENVLVYRRIGDHGYNRVGRYWVDERINDTTRITVVKFGTDAWFTLVERLPDLRPALAADRNIAVMVRDGYAIIVSETEGVEQFDEVSLKSAGIAGS